MVLNQATAIAALTLSIGGAVAFSNPNPWLSQTVAQDVNPPTRAERPQRPEPRWIQDLNLTPEQTQRMQAIQNQYKDRMRQNQEALRQAHQELQTMLGGNASQDEIRTKHRQVQTLMQQLDNLRFESMLAVREILTPEQRRIMSQRMQNMRPNPRNSPGNPSRMSPQ